MKKSLQKISLPITESEYRQLGGFSYSTLSSFLREGTPKCLISSKIEESDALRFGSLVDCLVTEPELLDERFFIQSFVMPPPAISKIIQYLFTLYSDVKSFTFLPDEIKLEACVEFNYGPT